MNDLDELRAAYAAAQAEADRPSLIVAHTHIAYPAPHAIDTAKAHGSPLGEDEVRATKEVLGWDPDEHFVVPDGVYEHMSQKARGAELEADWRKRFDALERGVPRRSRATGTRCTRAGRGRATRTRCPTFEAGEDMATRDAGKTVMQALKPFVPTMLGGAADLVESTKTELEGGGVFSATHAGRNIAFGIREHGMGSIVNGLALHGGIVKPYGSTFLVFSDYMRPAVRLSALMHAAGRLGVDARLGRARRGRPDAPAGRALRGAARDPEPLVHPSRPTPTRPPTPGRSRSTARTGRSRFR